MDRPSNRQSHRRRVPLGEARLMPVRIRPRRRACSVERGDLLGRQRPPDRAEILSQLFFVARADDHRRHRRPLQHPVQRDLRNGLARLPGDLVQRIDDAVEKFVRDRRAEVHRELRLEAGDRLACA